jgi:hypothetical protein
VPGEWKAPKPVIGEQYDSYLHRLIADFEVEANRVLAKKEPCNTPMYSTWCGEPVAEMSRERLMEAVTILGQQVVLLEERCLKGSLDYARLASSILRVPYAR